MWLIFFTGWGPFCVIEGLLLTVLRKRGLAPPSWISIPLTVVLGLTWGRLFFFPPAVQSGLYEDSVKALGAAFASVTNSFAPAHVEL